MAFIGYMEFDLARSIIEAEIFFHGVPIDLCSKYHTFVGRKVSGCCDCESARAVLESSARRCVMALNHAALTQYLFLQVMVATTMRIVVSRLSIL